MRRYISSGSTPAASSWPAIAWQRGDVLLKRKPPVSVRIAHVERRRRSAASISSPSTRREVEDAARRSRRPSCPHTTMSPAGSSVGDVMIDHEARHRELRTASASAPSRFTSLMSSTISASSAAQRRRAACARLIDRRRRRAGTRTVSGHGVGLTMTAFDAELGEQPRERGLRAAAVAVGVDVRRQRDAHARAQLRRRAAGSRSARGTARRSSRSTIGTTSGGESEGGAP